MLNTRLTCGHIRHIASGGSFNGVVNYTVHYQNLSLMNRHHHHHHRHYHRHGHHHHAHRIITTSEWCFHEETHSWLGHQTTPRTIVSCGRVISRSRWRGRSREEDGEKCGSVALRRDCTTLTLSRLLCPQVTRSCWRKGPASASYLVLVPRSVRVTARQSIAPARDWLRYRRTCRFTHRLCKYSS